MNWTRFLVGILGLVTIALMVCGVCSLLAWVFFGRDFAWWGASAGFTLCYIGAIALSGPINSRTKSTPH